jgi:hypothetical protein
MTEELLRGSIAYSTLRRGGTMDDAIASIVKYHFDYDDLNAFERSVMRRVVPFYTWTRKNFPLQVEQFIQKPQKFARYYQLRNEVEGVSDQHGIVPAYFGENLGMRLPFTVGKGQGYVLPDLPFATLNDVTDPSMAFSQVSPFIKTPIEYAFGQQVFKGIPLKDEYQPVPTWMDGVPGLFNGLQAIGLAQRNANGQWMMKQKNMYAVEQYLPTYGKARRLFPGEEQYDERVMSSWINSMFGLGLRSNTPTEQRNEAGRRVAAELERVQTWRELGLLTEADKVALDLARQIQTYKDEKANELREQISSERGQYATKEDIGNVIDKLETVVKPIQAWQSRATGAVLVLMLFAGAIGAIIGKALGG